MTGAVLEIGIGETRISADPEQPLPTINFYAGAHGQPVGAVLPNETASGEPTASLVFYNRAGLDLLQRAIDHLRQCFEPAPDERPDEFDVLDDGTVIALPAWARNNEAIYMRLNMVSAYPTEEEVAAWTDEQAREADVYACAAMLNASDNDDVKVPPKPSFLPNRRWIPGASISEPGTIVDADSPAA